MLKKIALPSLAIIISIPCGMYVAHRIHTDYTINHSKLPPIDILYIEHTGSYANMGKSLDQLKKVYKRDDTREQLDIISIFYDDPEVVPDETKHKAVFGHILNPADVLFNESLSKIPAPFKVAHLPELSTAGVEFPFLSATTFFWSLRKIHPELRKRVKKQGIVDEAGNTTVIQITQYQDDKPILQNSCVAYGPGSEQLEALRPK